MKKCILISILLSLTSVTALSSPLSVVEFNYKWDKSSIKVCWTKDKKHITQEKFHKTIQDSEFEVFNNKDRQAVQNLIQKEYTVDKVGIEFIGWNDCDLDADFDIAILGIQLKADSPESFKKLPLGSARIARKSKGGLMAAPEEKGYVFLLKEIHGTESISAIQNLMITALHEFSHSAGLRHEHIRPETKMDKNCRSLYSDENLDEINSERPVKATMIGDYDPQSIMNYCYNAALVRYGFNSDDDIKLSPGDIKSLRCMYKPDQEPEGSCEPKEFELNPEFKNILFPEQLKKALFPEPSK